MNDSVPIYCVTNQARPTRSTSVERCTYTRQSSGNYIASICAVSSQLRQMLRERFSTTTCSTPTAFWNCCSEFGRLESLMVSLVCCCRSVERQLLYFLYCSLRLFVLRFISQPIQLCTAIVGVILNTEFGCQRWAVNTPPSA